MPMAQVELTEAESQALEILGAMKGKTSGELLHQAVEEFLEQHQQEKRLAAMRQARGMWKDRKDLPDFEELRSEWDRT